MFCDIIVVASLSFWRSYCGNIEKFRQTLAEIRYFERKVSSLRQNYVIALDFGYPLNPQRRSSITDLADFIIKNYTDEPQTVVLAQDFIYDSLCRHGFPKNRLLEVGTGQSSTTGTESGGSYHMLREASAMLREMERDGAGTKPLMDDLTSGTWPPLPVVTLVAHALHAPRVVKQGRLFGLELTPAEGLPRRLYKNAAQWWCRSVPGWYLREVIGFVPLRLAGQI